jgi:hypothetical protein
VGIGEREGSQEIRIKGWVNQGRVDCGDKDDMHGEKDKDGR